MKVVVIKSGDLFISPFIGGKPSYSPSPFFAMRFKYREGGMYHKDVDLNYYRDTLDTLKVEHTVCVFEYDIYPL